MKKVITFRQLFYLFLVVSITPMLTVIPSELAVGNGSSAIISIGLSLIAIIMLAVLVGIFLYECPNKNFYEILIDLFGRPVAKGIILFYGIWAMTLLTTKLWQYTWNLQNSILANTRVQLLFIVMGLLVLYAFQKGIRTIFRFAEFVLVPILIIILIYVVSSFPNVRLDYVLEPNQMSFSELCIQAGYVLAVSGNLFLLLLYGDNIKDHSKSKKLFARFLGATVLAFILVVLLVTIVTFGLVGSHAAGSLATPFYIAMKGISVLNVVEHFEPILIVLMFLSDFLGICLYASVSLRCVKWLCSLRKIRFLYVPFGVFIYYLSLTLCRSQFDVEYLYHVVIVKWNLIMEFVIPFVILIVYYGKRKIPLRDVTN
ncbi:GerAB/ArcD/ProY family transporter [Anaerosporobacter faecicola]|uniref:GerAB/ArcD/ProY family transporter n=1 Tax=Anaerosporobacter faecicola TaxID=2718714 RepID=UPI001439A7AB|nr:GerAB/ArcD/ProY family transporter [Anaerosporobacter faecicola]